MPRRWLAVLATLAVSVFILTAGERGDAATAYEAEETEFLRLINDYRQDNGLRPLTLSDTLTAASERHSEDMAKYDFFAHNTEKSSYYPAGSRPWDRMEAEGYTYNTAKGENLAVGYESAEGAMRAWKDSPSHNAAMLEEAYKVIGVSRLNAPESTYAWYWTTDFGGENDSAPRTAGRSLRASRQTSTGGLATQPAEKPATSDPTATSREPAVGLADSGALENGTLGARGAWTQRARDGVDLVVDEGNARLGGYHDGEDDLRQKVRIGPDARLAYNVKVRAGTRTRADRLLVRLTDRRGRRLAVLDRYTGEDEAGWSRERADLSRFAGRTVFLSFHAKTDAARLTTFYVDDVSLRR